MAGSSTSLEIEGPVRSHPGNKISVVCSVEEAFQVDRYPRGLWKEVGKVTLSKLPNDRIIAQFGVSTEPRK